MLQAVGEAVGRAVVARGNADGKAEGCRVFKERVELGEGLLCP